MCAGRSDDALRQLQSTLDMDSTYFPTHWFLGELYVQRRDYRAAVRELEDAAHRAPRTSRVAADLGSAYALAGDRRKADSVLAQLRALAARGTYVSRYEYAIVYTGLGDRKSAMAELAGALDEPTWQVVNLKVDPMLASLRTDPGYAALLRRLGLPQ